MSNEANIAWLGKAAYDVDMAREQLARSIAARKVTVRKAHDEGMTIYRIAQVLGVTQGAVRKMLDL